MNNEDQILMRGLYELKPKWQTYSYFLCKVAEFGTSFEYAWMRYGRADEMMWMIAAMKFDRKQILDVIATCCQDEAVGLEEYYARFFVRLTEWCHGCIEDHELEHCSQYLSAHIVRKEELSDSVEVIHRVVTASQLWNQGQTFVHHAWHCFALRNSEEYMKTLLVQFPFAAIRERLIQIAD